MKLSTKAMLALCVASSACACATAAVPAARVRSSEAAIRSARDAGAERVPEAAVHLELAQHQLAQARGFLEQREEKKASWMLARAQADAELAAALTHEARTRRAAEEIAARVRDLASGTHASSGEPL